MPETNARIKVCHDTAANFKTNNPTLLVGEWALETDTKKMKIGDGSTAYNALPYSTAEDSDEWIKPDDWIDIRSGALPNSIYFLVAHSVPTESSGTYSVSTYPFFQMQVYTNDSSSYDIYIDGIKFGTFSSGTNTVLDWGVLYTNKTIISGFDIAYPSTMVSHVIRVTPSVSDAVINRIFCTSSLSSNLGVLWSHLSIKNKIGLANFMSRGISTVARADSLEAVTASDNKIFLSGSSYATFAHCGSLKKIPVFDASSVASDGLNGMFFNCTSLKKIVIDNLAKNVSCNNFVSNCYNLKNIELTGDFSPFHLTNQPSFDNCLDLQKLPPLDFSSYIGSRIGNRIKNIEPTILDMNSAANLMSHSFGATQNDRLDCIKGLTVSPEAPFDSNTSPQLNVSYTGLSRAALVNLFKSMPYNVGYTVVGSPTIVDGVASGFSTENKLTLPNSPVGSSLDGLEFGTKFTTTASSVYQAAILWTSYGGTGFLGVLNNNKLHCSLGRPNSSSSHAIEILSDVMITNDTYYWLRLKCDNGVAVFDYSTDGISYTSIGQAEYSGLNITNTFGLGSPKGSGSFGVFQGSIDLNSTYIKVNGIPWFTGKEAMTKTCSVVGCTGTADLTQDDKNIALNKGWELTVA